MTATDELRRLLDERGVEYRIREGKDGFRRFTYWQGTAGNGYPFYARYEQEHYAEGEMTVLEINMHKYQLTPAEAIEATLGGDLKAENDKLRELVRELWNCALQYHRFDVYRHEIGVDGCGIGCMANGEDCCACKLEQRMRELVVKV